MSILSINTSPFDDQRPGISGLRRKTRRFMEEHYLENFIQSIFDVLSGGNALAFQDKTLVIGGDGRYFNREAMQRIIRMAAANSFARVMVGRSGIVTTPAVSAVIRANHAFGGFVLSASHNQGGIDKDFGIKYNITSGAPSPETLTEKFFAYSKQIKQYRTLDHPDIDLDTLANYQLLNTEVVVFDNLADYTSLMEKIFDFDALRALFKSGFRLRFDAMHAATGPFAHHIFERCLEAPEGTVVNGTPLPDFGGGHPDPNLRHAHELIEFLAKNPDISLGAASDGDGDRNMIIGPNFFVSPGDSLAVITEYAPVCIPYYKNNISGVARSMPTSTAVDRVAESLGVPCYEVPTGWKFFGNLMDANKCTICGEESFGTGSSHMREKDGIWAVLSWLSVLAHARKSGSAKSVEEVVKGHWKKFGRSYYQRQDFEGLNSAEAAEMFEGMRSSISSYLGKEIAGRKVVLADDFSYHDPVDQSVAVKQGLRFVLEDNSRLICRLSDSDTSGATLRIYLEVYRKDGGLADINETLKPLARAAKDMLKLQERFGKEEPSVIT